MATRREVMAWNTSGTYFSGYQVSGFIGRITRNFQDNQRLFRKPRGHTMVRVVRGLCTFASILLLAAMPARAQLATAELNGRVTDDSGAVLPGATVTVTQTATGLVRTAVTESNGTYLLSNLPTGPYRL